jgi:hypothetical protein
LPGYPDYSHVGRVDATLREGECQVEAPVLRSVLQTGVSRTATKSLDAISNRFAGRHLASLHRLKASVDTQNRPVIDT